MNRTLKKILLIFLSAILLQSCQNSPKDIVDGGEYKYWYKVFPVKDEEGRYFYQDTTYYYFGNDWKYIIIVTTGGEWHEYDGYDDLYTKLWKIENDTLTISNFHKYKIVELNDERMIRSWKNERLDTLYAVPKEKIPKEFRRKW